jgi:hypothetical protein
VLSQIHPPLIKGIVRTLDVGGRDLAHSIRYNKLKARQGFFYNLDDKVSREEHKTIYSGVRISGIAWSNQSDLVLESLFKNRPIPQDDLQRMAKSRKKTYRDWPIPGIQAGISQEDLI